MASSPETLPGHEYVDFDEYIDIQLRRTRSTIKATDLLTAVVGVATLLTAYLFVFVLFDHWVVPGGFSPVTRGIMLAGVIAAVCLWLGIKVVWPLRRRVTGLYAASTIEKAAPGLKSSLLNLVDLTQSERKVRPEIYASLERRAAVELTHVDVNEAVDRKTLLRFSIALLAVVVLFCAYWVFSPKNPATSLWRAIMPSASVGVSTQTEIYSVRPGDTEVVARSQVPVTAYLRGEIPPQTYLEFTTADHKFVDERIEMRMADESTREFRCVLNGENGAGVLQDMTYRIVAGDARTQDFTIRVMQPPTATIKSIRLEPPSYTGRQTVTQTTGAIDALEGTDVTLDAVANMPLASASLQFFDEESAAKREEEIPIHVAADGTKLHVEWKLAMRSNGTYPHYYRIFCTSTSKGSDPSPSLYSLTIRPDRPPEIVLIDPKGDLDLPANTSVLPLLIEARDDFGLSYINLRIEKNGSPLNGPDIYGHDRHEREFKTRYDWSLKDYHLRSGETLSYWLEAQDNKQPIANTANTPKLRIRIIDPVSEEQVKKNLARAQERQKEQAQNSDSENADKKDADQKQDKDQAGQNEKSKKGNRPQQAKDQQPRGDENPKQDTAQRKEQDQRDSSQGGNSHGDKEKGQRGNKDNSKSKDQSQQQLNPDDPADDAQALKQLTELDKKQREKNQQDKSKGSQGDAQKDQSSDDQSTKGEKPTPSDQKYEKDNKQSTSGQKADQDGTRDSKKQDAADQQQANDAQQQDGKQANGEKPAEQPQNNAQNQQGAPPVPSPGIPRPQPPSPNPLQKTSPASAQPSNPGSQPQPGADQHDQQHKDAGNGQGQGPPQPDHQDKNKPEDASGNPSEPTKDGPRKDSNPQSGNNQSGNNQSGNNQAGNQQQGNQNSAGTESQRQGSQKAADQKDQAGKNDQNQSGQKNNNQDNNRGQSDGGKDSNGKNPSGNQKGDQSDAKQQNNNQQDASQQNGNQKNSDQQNPSQPNGGQTKGAQAKDDQHKDSSQAQRNQKPDADLKDRGQRSSQTSDHNPEKSSNQKPADQKPSDRNNNNPERKNLNPNSSDQKNTATQKPAGQPSANDRTGANDRDPNRADQKGKPDSAPRKADETHRPDQRPNDAHNPAGRDDIQRDPRTRPKDARQKREPDDNLPPGTRARDQQPQVTQGRPGMPNQGNEGRRADGSSESATKSADKDAGAQQSREQQNAQQQEQSNKPGAAAREGQQGAAKEQAQDGSGKTAAAGKPGEQGAQSDSKTAGQQGKGNERGKSGGPSRDGQSASQKSDSSPAKGGAQGGNQGNSAKSNDGGWGHNTGTGAGPGTPLHDTSNEANLDYAKKATNLVLNRLDKELKRGAVDKKVMEKLGWTDEEVRRFVQRMRKQMDSLGESKSPADEARRLQMEETLRTVFQSKARRTGSSGAPKSVASEIEGRRSEPPADIKELYEAYTKSVAKDAAARDSGK